jgi:hypothetical protein
MCEWIRAKWAVTYSYQDCVACPKAKTSLHFKPVFENLFHVYKAVTTDRGNPDYKTHMQWKPHLRLLWGAIFVNIKPKKILSGNNLILLLLLTLDQWSLMLIMCCKVLPVLQ